ncbi:MAG: hypothetical protein WBF99_12450 [Xanthobacteraceae bacterium]
MATASVLKNPFEFESQAKADDEATLGKLAAKANDKASAEASRLGAESVSRLASRRSEAATSEPMDVTGGESAATSFILDEAAFMEALDPLPVFLSAPRVDPDRELSRKSQPGMAASLSAVLRELSELVHPQDLEGRRT